jgi:hypothetical protein
VISATARRKSPSPAAATYTPPWLAEPGSVPFEGERRLTPAEIQMISQWVAAGAPEGPADEIPALANFPAGWQLGTPDMILEAPAAYEVPTSGPDVHWNFVLKPNRPSPVYVRAVGIRPGGGPEPGPPCQITLGPHGRIPSPGNRPWQRLPGMDLEIMRSPFDPPATLCSGSRAAPHTRSRMASHGG